MDDFKSEKWILEDGRRAERRVTDSVNPSSGEAERVVELHVEDERPLRLQQRVVEKRKPIVYEREIQTLDKEGKIVEKKIEVVEPKASMQLVQHIAADNTVQALADTTEDCHVTKEEMIQTIVAAIKTLKEDLVSDPVPSRSSLADEIAKRATTSDGSMDKVMWLVILALVGGLVYVGFWM